MVGSRLLPLLGVLIGAVFGVVLASIYTLPRAQVLDWYYAAHPVVKYQSEIVGRTADFVLIHIWGEKLQDCYAMPGTLETFALHGDTRFGAKEQRESGDTASRPVGKADLGVWKVWPIEGAQRIEMYVLHDCRGHTVRSKIADVVL